MNVTDMLLQMTLQSQWQMPEVSQMANGAASEEQTASFRDLLEQQHGRLQQSKEADGTEENEATGEQPVSEDSETDDTVPDELTAMAAAGAALLVNYETQLMQTAPVQAEISAVAVPVQVIVEPAGTQQEGDVQLPQAQTETGLIQQPADSEPLDEIAPASVPAEAGETVPDMSEEKSSGMSPSPTNSDAHRSRDENWDGVSVENWQSPLFRKVESMPVRVADTAVDMSAPAQDVEKSMGSVLKAGLESGTQYLKIKLTPENLGTVVAEFSRSPEGILHVVLHAETEQTAKLLNSHASALGLMLQDGTNSQVKVEVPQPQQSQPFWQQPDQQQQQQQQEQRQQQQRQHTMQQESESFLHQLRLGLLRTEYV